ncbi:MAG: RNA-binding protein [Proteobacteria bacterium]|nr:MAG: RNA-binding protein [Pseudomonadota bacterium]PIE67310.1 MAG: RNA-binding protein [Deltaproteobacteria bacterium]
MKQLVEEIAKALVDMPEQVSVNEIETQQSVVVELAVAKQDLGKIIGRKGQNVQAIRAILNAASGKIKKRIILELLE